MIWNDVTRRTDDVGKTIFGYLLEHLKCMMPEECRQDMSALDVKILTDGQNPEHIRAIIVIFSSPGPIDNLVLWKTLETIRFTLNMPQIKHTIEYKDKKYIIAASFGSLTE